MQGRVHVPRLSSTIQNFYLLFFNVHMAIHFSATIMNFFIVVHFIYAYPQLFPRYPFFISFQVVMFKRIVGFIYNYAAWTVVVASCILSAKLTVHNYWSQEKKIFREKNKTNIILLLINVKVEKNLTFYLNLNCCRGLFENSADRFSQLTTEQEDKTKISLKRFQRLAACEKLVRYLFFSQQRQRFCKICQMLQGSKQKICTLKNG